MKSDWARKHLLVVGLIAPNEYTVVEIMKIVGVSPLVSGYKSNNSIWLIFPALGFLNSLFISSSCKEIF